MFLFTYYITELFLNHQDRRNPHQSRAEELDGWMDGCLDSVQRDAAVLHHSPVIFHLECVNQDSVYAKLRSPDRFIQHELVFGRLQRQRKYKLLETIYHRRPCCFKGRRS